MTPPFRSVDEVVDTLQRLDGRPTEDVVGGPPHLLQTAQRLARDHPATPSWWWPVWCTTWPPASSRAAPTTPAGAALVAPLLGPGWPTWWAAIPKPSATWSRWSRPTPTA